MAGKQSKIPKIKKKISSFLTKEDGKISKEALIKAGLVAAIASGAIGSASAYYDCSGKGGDVTPKDGCDSYSGNSNSCSEATASKYKYFQTTSSSLSIDFDDQSGELTGTHSHHSDHCSHSSHGSHGSHGSHSSW